MDINIAANGDIQTEEDIGLWGNVVIFLQLIQDHWLGNFLLNVLGYAILIVPTAFLIRRWKADPRIKKGQGPVNALLKMLVFGDIEEQDPMKDAEEGKGVGSGTVTPVSVESSHTAFSYYGKLLVCIAGLQGAYLTWGVLQERVMTYSYDGEKFTNSQFLVFVNRILALVVAGMFISLVPQPRHKAPLYKYSYSSISNTLSSWCQYEALKFVSFPTQVLAKASKVIPVMLMGKAVSNRTYPWHEYGTAILISLGVSLFLLSADPTQSGDDAADSAGKTETTLAGIVILVGYMAFDSFTSNWQSELFKTYQVSSVQMMFGVNLFSCIFTVFSLLFRGVFFTSLSFLFRHLEFAFHAGLISICSAIGQLFIFQTISLYGPIVFTLIMTTRQAISIIISCIMYGHLLTSQALVGVLVVFIALFLRVYFKSLGKK